VPGGGEEAEAMIDGTEAKVERVAALLRERGDLLAQVAEFLVTDGLVDEASFEIAERVCVAAFGHRVECPICESPVFPGFLCWGCEEWVAPEPEGGAA
jgi:hypothetical protein